MALYDGHYWVDEPEPYDIDFPPDDDQPAPIPDWMLEQQREILLDELYKDVLPQAPIIRKLGVQCQFCDDTGCWICSDEKWYDLEARGNLKRQVFTQWDIDGYSKPVI